MGGSQNRFDRPHLKNFLSKKNCRGWDAISAIINHSNNSHANLKCPCKANHAFIDSAALDNCENKITPLCNIAPTKNAQPVNLTNGCATTPTKTGSLSNPPSISNKNKACQKWTSNAGPALMSVGKLYDENCLTACNNLKFIVRKDKPILKSMRCPTSGMYVTGIANPLLWTLIKHLNANL